MRRIRSRDDESIRGLPGLLARRRQRRRTPSRCHRSTGAGWTSTSASLHRGHNHRNNSQSRRSAARKRRCERARTPSWWRRASVSSRRSIRVAWAALAEEAALEPPRIGCRVPSGDPNVKVFAGRDIGEPHRLTCSPPCQARSLGSFPPCESRGPTLRPQSSEPVRRVSPGRNRESSRGRHALQTDSRVSNPGGRFHCRGPRPARAQFVWRNQFARLDI